MSTEQSIPPTVRDAGAPYADNDADVILRSSDGVDFRVHRLFLSKASPVFADMFALGSGTGVAGDEHKDDLRIVEMSEDEKSLRTLLGYCYLALEPVILENIEDAERAFRVADKFQLSRARVLAADRLKELAKQDPERVYAIGWKMRARDIVQAAALESLARPYTVELPTIQGGDDLPSSALLKLFGYQRACIDAAQLVPDLSWFYTDMLQLDSGDFAGRKPLIREPGSSSVGQENCTGQLGNCSTGIGMSRTSTTLGTSLSAAITLPLVHSLNAARSVLKTHPRGDAVDFDNLVQISISVTVSSGMRCERCARYHVALLSSLTKLLASQVEKVVSEVSFH